MLASNLNRLFLHTKQYHFQFPIRLFLSYQANIRSNYCNPQMIYFLSFFNNKPFTCISCNRVPVVLTHVLQIFIVLTFFFCFISAFFMRISHLSQLTEKIFWPSQVTRTSETFSEILLMASYLFFSIATGGKNGSGSNWYLLLMIRFYANGNPPLDTMRKANLASSDSHL